MKTVLLFLTYVVIVSCQTKITPDLSQNEVVAKAELEERYIDSTNIGIPKKYKFDLKKFRTPDSNYVDIHLYERKNGGWILKQQLHFTKDGVLSCDPEFNDFNNDGFNDVTFRSMIAARGANIIRKLLIFD